jgi:hypothetical protein
VERDTARSQAAALEVERDRWLAEHDTLATDLNAARTERDAARAQRDVAWGNTEWALAEREAALAMVETFATSTSWRLTAPLRAARRGARQVVAVPRRTVGAARVAMIRAALRALPAPVARRMISDPLFLPDWYLSRNPDVAREGVDPERHYRSHGHREGRDPNDVFDTDWYLRTYPDVASSGLNPLDHYWLFGAREGRDPGPGFSTSWYQERYPDVRSSGMNPLEHYLRHGRAEGRRPTGDAEQGPLVSSPASDLPVPAPISPRDRPQEVDRLLSALRKQLPPGSQLAIMDGGDERLRAIDGMTTSTFPPPMGKAGAEGQPVVGIASIAALEHARIHGVRFLVVPGWASAGLERDRLLAKHLTGRYPQVPLGHGHVLFRLQPVPSRTGHGAPRPLADIIEAWTAAQGREPAILDWQGVIDEQEAAGLTVFRPIRADGGLPYLDATIDIVVIADQSPQTVSEARRVAASMVLLPHRDGGSFDILWDAGDDVAGTSVSLVVAVTGVTDEDADRLLEAARGAVEARVTELIVVGPARRLTIMQRLPKDPPLLRTRIVASPEGASMVEMLDLGARRASGTLVLFTTSGVLVLPGALGHLIRSLDTWPTVGLVTGRIIMEDGSLVEAGRIALGDGGTIGVGQGECADDPLFTFARDTDASSGLLSGARRAVLERFGGLIACDCRPPSLDELCLRIAEGGERVRYEPRAVAMAEGGREAVVAVGALDADLTRRWTVVGPRPQRPAELSREAWRDLLQHVTDDAGAHG